MPWPAAAAGNTVGEVVETVREAIKRQETDSQLAKTLHKLNLGEKLDWRTAEELESMAPGAKSIAEIERLRESSSGLRVPKVLPAFDSPPPPDAGDMREILHQAQRSAASYLEGLPDFICTETVRRYEAMAGRSWTAKDTLTLQLTYFEHEENYKLTLLNGRKTRLDFEEMGGALSKGEFASVLLSLFANDSATRFQWQNWTTLRKRPACVFSFRILVRNSHYSLTAGPVHGRQVSAVTGEHGLVYVDSETKRVVRITSEADSIPANFPIQAATRALDYGFTDVSGRSYLLPLQADVRMVTIGRLETRNDVQFAEYRKFSGESTISFGDPGEEKPAVKK